MRTNPKFKGLIPPLAPEELAQLEENILRDGCRDPLVVWKGVVVDGHNRLEICERHGLPFKSLEMEFADEEAVCDWIDSNQLGRRNLTPDQRSLLRGRRYRHKKGHGGDRKSEESSCQSGNLKTAKTIGDQHGVSERTVIRDGRRAAFIEKLRQEAPEEAKAIEHGHKRIKQVQRERKKASLQKAASLPNAKYRVIYADPPWCYNQKCDNGGVQAGGGCEQHYPSMTIAELCALPIRDLCEENAVLFLWVTSPLLFECAPPVIKSWGFDYKQGFVWDKVKHNLGHYHSVRHEHLLICTRGSCTPDSPKLFDSVQSIERLRHSEKPPVFRSIIEELYPHGKKLELFAREKAPGWEVWGNEIECEPKAA